MTLQFMEGFETCIDHSDLTGRGWSSGTSTTVSGTSTLTVPSRTSVAGRGLMLKGPYSSNTSPPLATPASVPDFGMVNTGKSVYSLWQSGGFSIGFNATFNSGTQTQIAPGDTQQIVYDGAQYYWAIVYSGSTYAVAYSTDLVNWTLTSSQPASLSVNSTISVSGSGNSATILVGTKSGNSAITPQYSTNMGGLWTNMSIGASSSMKNVSPTGNATAPYVGIGWTSGSYYRIYTYASLGATPAVLSSPAVTGSGTYAAGWTRVENSMILACGMLLAAAGTAPASGASAGLAYCPVTSDPTNSANWTLLPSISNYLNDAVWFNNRIVAVGYGGIYWNGAASSNVWQTGYNNASSSVWSIAASGSRVVAVGQDPTNAQMGAIWTSTDGVNWTKINRFIVASATVANGNMFANVIWNGSKFMITGGLNNNVIATSTDGLSWTPIYYPDYSEQTGTGCGSFLGVYAGSLSGGVFTGWTTQATQNNGFGIAPAAASGGARNVGMMVVNGQNGVSFLAPNTSVSTSQLTHFYEIIATAVAGSPNLFTWQIAVDGNIVSGSLATNSNSGLLAPATDTAGSTKLFVNLPRSGNWTVVDDIYITSFAADAASGNVGQLGPINIVGATPASDSQSQFSLNGTAASHAAEVAGALSNSEGSVYTYTLGAKDIYGLSVSIPANNVIQAVQAEAYFSKYGQAGANATVGVVSSTSEVDSSQAVATTTTPVFTSVLQTVDPATSAQWTTSGVQASKIAITKAT